METSLIPQENCRTAAPLMSYVGAACKRARGSIPVCLHDYLEDLVKTVTSSSGRAFWICVMYVFLVLGGYSHFATAQTSGGLTGTVADTTGALVPEAQVEVTNESTGVVQRTRASQAGTFSVTGFAPWGLHGTRSSNRFPDVYPAWRIDRRRQLLELGRHSFGRSNQRDGAGECSSDRSGNRATADRHDTGTRGAKRTPDRGQRQRPTD